MSDRFLFGLMMIRIFLLIILLSFPVYADDLTGRVVKVVDGDTLTVLDSKNVWHKIRLQGIDAPEKGQPYGRASGKHLSRLIAGRNVVVAYHKRDRYGRIVGTVQLSGQDINLTQVDAGMAWHYQKYQKKQSQEERESYSAAEIEARRAKRGFGREPQPCHRGSGG